METVGRSPDHMKILPGAFVVVGDTVEAARAKKRKLDSLVHPDSGIASLSVALGTDVSGFDLDGALPEIPESNASQSGRQRLVDMAARDNLTVRELAQIVGGAYGAFELIGTPATIPHQMGGGVSTPARDGLNGMVPLLPQR